MVRVRSLSKESPKAQRVSVVTQIRVLPDREAEFDRWQRQVTTIAARIPGFIDVEIIEPAPPFQHDWVIVQRFNATAAARGWLESTQRQRLLDELHPYLVGDVDVHLFAEPQGRQPSPVSAIISTPVAPDKEPAFLDWHRRIVAAQADFPGYEGYRLERPIPGIQDAWVAILRFDSESHLDAWLNSEQRRALLREGASFGEGASVRVVKSGFDSWFPPSVEHSATTAPPWKQNMLVLLVLYPLVFLFGKLIQDPLLLDNGVPFWAALFIGNAVSVALLGWVLIPWASRLFKWWLSTPGPHATRTNTLGTATVLLLYGVCLALFAAYP